MSVFVIVCCKTRKRAEVLHEIERVHRQQTNPPSLDQWPEQKGIDLMKEKLAGNVEDMFFPPNTVKHLQLHDVQTFHDYQHVLYA